MDGLLQSRDTAIVPDHVVVEFGSLLRKFVNQESIVWAEAESLFSHAMSLGPIVGPSEDELVRGFELATQLGQSDTFDASG